MDDGKMIIPISIGKYGRRWIRLRYWSWSSSTSSWWWPKKVKEMDWKLVTGRETEREESSAWLLTTCTAPSTPYLSNEFRVGRVPFYDWFGAERLVERWIWNVWIWHGRRTVEVELDQPTRNCTQGSDRKNTRGYMILLWWFQYQDDIQVKQSSVGSATLTLW